MFLSEWSFEKVAEGIEVFGLLCRFEVSESVGDFFFPESLQGGWFFVGCKFIPDLPILFDSDVFIESFGLNDFGHQQFAFYYIYKRS